ncbi:MAG: hypothetical protein JSW71_15495 [Gemmatimonadota bacterium]|nr:MAG: hypothetical protein JSW71_15495 [Gemmatimonadota bacterium]
MTALWVPAVTGASGAPYAVRLLQVLVEHDIPVRLIVSSHGWRLLSTEMGITDEAGLRGATGGRLAVDQLGLPTLTRLHAVYPDAEIIVYGHTDRPLLELVDEIVAVTNPGFAGSVQGDELPTVGILELEPGLPPRARLVSLESAG